MALTGGPALAESARPRGIGVGDIAPRFALADVRGVMVDPYGDTLAGKPTAVVFCADAAQPETQALLTSFQEILGALTEHGTKVLAVTRDTPADNETLCGQLGLDFPVLADPMGESFRPYGVRDDSEAVATVLLGPNQHLRLVLRRDGETHAAKVLEEVARLAAARRSMVMDPHPPVLVVPDVLSPADCQRLMTVFAMEGNVFIEPGHGDKGRREDYKMRIPEYGRRDRIDHFIMNPRTRDFIFSRYQARLFPEIRRAFQYRVTKYEPFRIACYEGERGGELHGHRDNTQPQVAHRRFAVSVNLNTEDFEGGEIRFPEFGDQRYRPASGAAIVFSCSLLHEVLHVTRGRRFVVLAFLAGET